MSRFLRKRQECGREDYIGKGRGIDTLPLETHHTRELKMRGSKKNRIQAAEVGEKNAGQALARELPKLTEKVHANMILKKDDVAKSKYYFYGR